MVGEYFHLWRQQFLMSQIKDSTVIVIWKSGGFDWRELQATWILCATLWYFLDVLFSWAINVWHPYATLCHPLPPWATLSHLVDNPRHLPRWEQPPVLSHLPSKKPNWYQLLKMNPLTSIIILSHQSTALSSSRCWRRDEESVKTGKLRWASSGMQQNAEEQSSSQNFTVKYSKYSKISKMQ